MQILSSLPLFVLVGASFLNKVAAQNDEASLAELVPLIPSCALPCIVQGLSQMPDALSDPSATCSNISLQASISACVQAACSFADQARLGIVNGKLCDGVPEDRSRVIALLAISCSFGFPALIAIGLRTYARQHITKQMGSDDWTMLIAGLILAAALGLNFHNMFDNGFGKHYWNLDIPRVTPLLKIFYASEIIYVVEITMIKISILLFYLRVFPGYWLRMASYVTMTLVISSSIAVLIPIFFQCSPIRGAWDRSITSKCININLLTYGAGGIAVGLDIVILLLPIPDLLKLNMSHRKKCHVLFMFSLGSIACITSIVRLKYLADFAKSTDPTWDNTIGVMVSLMEICVAMICACLPALRLFFCTLLPSIFGRETSTADSSESNPYPSRKNKISNDNSDAIPLSSVGAKSLFTGTLSTASRDRASYGRLDSSANDKITQTTSTQSGKEAWFGTNGVITQGQEFVQDVERGALPPLRYDGVSRSQTVTTKIWVEEPSSAHVPIKLSIPHIAASMKPSEGKISERNDIQLQLQSMPVASTSKVQPPLSRFSSEEDLADSRRDSDESIFVLQGPRKSDIDITNRAVGFENLGGRQSQHGTEKHAFDFGLAPPRESR